MATVVVRETPSWLGALQRSTYRLGVVTVAGGLLGLAIGGVGGRLAMMLLARLNPEATGLISDDGFHIGQFTVAASLNLLILTTLVGILGGGIYLAVRPLMIGPRWFQLLSISVGPAIVVGPFSCTLMASISQPCGRSGWPWRCSWSSPVCTPPCSPSSPIGG